MNILGFFQRLGRALQLPIAVLPVAALLLRFGQPDLLNVPFIAQAGGAIFDNLALIFAIGVASSWSKDNAGSAALAGAVGYFVMTKAMVTINPEINMGVLAGIITGLVAGAVYNRWAGIKLPDFLSFFGGKRFVPIATGFFCLILAALFGYVWPPVQHAIHAGGEWIVSAGALGSGIFGFINRLLIPTGLHQVLNTIAWFQIGEFTNAAGAVFHGDINRFYAGDGTAGMFMSGFFPIMMFGLPGAALAMYLAAPKARRPMVGGMLLSVAITAFLTGVTEPLEFLFMFLAPLLYLLHAVLTGISLFIATALGIHAGFSFSAGAIDYVLMYSLPAASKNVWMLLVMGVVFFFVYFLLFSAVIRMFNLKTPGREDKAADVVTEEANSNTEEGLTQLATSYIAAVGGTDNLKAIDACITRLRLTVGDSAKVNDAACKRLGASGVVKLNKQTIQVIVGAKAESIGDEMKKVVTRGPVAAAAAAPAGNVATAAPAAKPQAVANAKTVESLVSPITGDVVALEQVPDEAFASKAVGDGIAVKPTSNIVVAPAAGTVVKIFNTNHAFCLETNNGAEIVVHMGIDTVALEGKGFKRLVEEGADVKAGEPILEMDLDFLNANARSMISPVVCSNSDDYSALVILASGKVVAGQTPLYEIKGK
ncbi:TPA: PTS N-acetyl glucosamine transporter subunit IIABC [Klebsiella quasipneumoniae subsp. quasipneumoniae]|jgi:PTS system N-acetylglucosamine-specific IIC component|uniref:PTS N-acetyl glucosamine transporter subunit IIABC n=1 Tax=Klebsiella quasipneumoniae subsp. quasipneumoniae TaxID=1667327 RepID=A0AAW8XNZ9_9ENTR|nr:MULTISPECIES: PTS N-acetyl glucosamine transporter subunit IIABC [Klebsiella]KAE9752628.1 PTS N-acetyl glucosamine transporter subunit IIABC [Enterobacteriaceae bacterium TzEc084]MVY09815.1 PTS N-acetyl glucosamine transporter subunit IIABC [Enterobacteriaceae bacterium 8376wH8]HDZ9752193.1 PTS N-acetyl glucosamine transporter subunit IIABC [Klebsiella quasipneumoniae subsp. similipneumoniae]AZA43407.1 PTS N-acetyl glucosamine transporter subunit IIABC [Klebsiella quasipneumoniae]EIY5093207